MVRAAGESADGELTSAQIWMRLFPRSYIGRSDATGRVDRVPIFTVHSPEVQLGLIDRLIGVPTWLKLGDRHGAPRRSDS
jgi:hypothetical protein